MQIVVRWIDAYSLSLRFGLPSNRARRSETAAYSGARQTGTDAPAFHLAFLIYARTLSGMTEWDAPGDSTKRKLPSAVDGTGTPCSPYDLVATGDTRRSRSTRKGNRDGWSVEEGYLDECGRAVTKHTVYDCNGRIIHGPHFRPGGFK